MRETLKRDGRNSRREIGGADKARAAGTARLQLSNVQLCAATGPGPVDEELGGFAPIGDNTERITDSFRS